MITLFIVIDDRFCALQAEYLGLKKLTRSHDLEAVLVTVYQIKCHTRHENVDFCNGFPATCSRDELCSRVAYRSLYVPLVKLPCIHVRLNDDCPSVLEPLGPKYQFGHLYEA